MMQKEENGFFPSLSVPLCYSYQCLVELSLNSSFASMEPCLSGDWLGPLGAQSLSHSHSEERGRDGRA